MIYYLKITKTRGAEAQMEAVAIPYCGCVLHVHLFSPKKIAAVIVLNIAILDLDISCTRRLIYYKAMTKTSGAEVQMGAVTD